MDVVPVEYYGRSTYPRQKCDAKVRKRHPGCATAPSHSGGGDGTESATFQYDESWLKNPERFALEPALQMDAAPHHTDTGKRLFGAIGDSAPDRWGRALMMRAEARREKKAGDLRHVYGGV
jgi:HipA N-terminal domain